MSLPTFPGRQGPKRNYKLRDAGTSSPGWFSPFNPFFKLTPLRSTIKLLPLELMQSGRSDSNLYPTVAITDFDPTRCVAVSLERQSVAEMPCQPRLRRVCQFRHSPVNNRGARTRTWKDTSLLLTLRLILRSIDS